MECYGAGTIVRVLKSESILDFQNSLEKLTLTGRVLDVKYSNLVAKLTDSVPVIVYTAVVFLKKEDKNSVYNLLNGPAEST